MSEAKKKIISALGGGVAGIAVTFALASVLRLDSKDISLSLLGGAAAVIIVHDEIMNLLRK